MKKVLCIVPHGDDDVISFGGLLLKYRNEGAEIHMVYLTMGGKNLKDGYNTRMSEVLDVCDVLHVKRENLYVLYKDMDGEMDTVSQREITSWIDRLTDKIQPDILLTTLNSNHQDHHALYKAVRASLRMRSGYIIPKVLFGEYQFLNVEVDIPFNGKCYIEMSEELMNDKLNLFSLYKSQQKLEPSPLGLKGIQLMAEHRGIEFGCKYAECYYVYRYKI